MTHGVNCIRNIQSTIWCSVMCSHGACVATTGDELTGDAYIRAPERDRRRLWIVHMSDKGTVVLLEMNDNRSVGLQLEVCRECA
jgi:hypothetical protein